MADYFYSIVLGIVQGLTEFLPVSSTAHMVLVHEATGFTTGSDPAFDIALQLATAIAVLVYFRRDIAAIARSVFAPAPGQDSGRTYALAIVLGTIPAALAGFLLEDWIEGSFRDSSSVAYALIAGSILMLAAEHAWKKRAVPKGDVTLGKGVAVGLFEALALIPGVSRSGSTISGGLLLGLERSAAVRFSFLLSIPILFGASLKKLIDIDGSALMAFAGPLSAGFIVSFLVGLASIHVLTMYLKTRTFAVFIWYRLALATVILTLM